MAKFCSDTCKQKGANCEFCKSLKFSDNEEKEYTCNITGKEVNLNRFIDCDDYECFLVE